MLPAEKVSFNFRMCNCVLAITSEHLSGKVAERWSLTSELSLSYARPAADGRPLMWVN